MRFIFQAACCLFGNLLRSTLCREILLDNMQTRLLVKDQRLSFKGTAVAPLEMTLCQG